MILACTDRYDTARTKPVHGVDVAQMFFFHLPALLGETDTALLGFSPSSQALIVHEELPSALLQLQLQQGASEAIEGRRVFGSRESYTHMIVLWASKRNPCTRTLLGDPDKSMALEKEGGDFSGKSIQT